HPIHLPFHSSLPSSPIDQETVSLQSPAWPSSSQARTFQYARCSETSSLPSYSTCCVAALVTTPLSHKSPLSSSSSSGRVATSTLYALCAAPLRPQATIHPRRGRPTSIPSGSSEYSVRSRCALNVSISPPP